MRARSLSRRPSSILLAALVGLALGGIGSMNGCGGDTPLPLGTLGAACYSGGKGPCGRCNAELVCNNAGICIMPDPSAPAAVCPDAGGGDATAGPDGAPVTDGGAPEVGADAPAADGGAAGHDGGGAAGSDGAADQAPATDGGGDGSDDAVDGGDA